MARKFNGTSDAAQITVDLSGFSLLTVSFWLWWDAFANNDKLAMEYTPTFNSNAGFIVDPNSTAPANGLIQIGFTKTGPVAAWVDGFARPSAAAWHQYMIVMNRATPSNAAWVDGAPQTLTTGTHTAGTYGNFANSVLNIMSRNKASLFGAGRMADLAIWGGVALGTVSAKALAGGAHPMDVHPDNIVLAPPFFGADSPEPDYSGKQHSATLTGTSFAAHPPVTTGLFRPRRSFQPMPV